MSKNTLQWLETEYCIRPNETIQPVLVNDMLYYTLFDSRGFNYVFSTVYALSRHLMGDVNQYEFTCGKEEDLIDYLENK